MKEVRAQVSIEFLMVTGVALFLLASTTYFIFDFTRANSEQNAMQQSAQIGYRLIDEVRNVYIYGTGSFVTVTASQPDAIFDAYTVENDTLVFEVLTRNGPVGIPVFSAIPINGTRLVGERTHLGNETMVVHPGRTQYRVESMGTWVQITQVS